MTDSIVDWTLVTGFIKALGLVPEHVARIQIFNGYISVDHYVYSHGQQVVVASNNKPVTFNLVYEAI